MGRKSTRENKNIYQCSREAAGLTREAAAEKIGFISADRLEKIESGKSQPHTDEILPLTECYQDPELCAVYCAEECPIGRQYTPKAEKKSLSQLTVEILASLNSLERERERLIEISVDGVVSQDETGDFEQIRRCLCDMESTIRSLRLWSDSLTDPGKHE